MIPYQNFFDFVGETKPDYPNKDFPRYAKDAKSALNQYGIEKLKELWKKYLGISGFFFDKAGNNETKSLRVFFGHLAEIISMDTTPNYIDPRLARSIKAIETAKEMMEAKK